jgi:hypothetical protein
MTGQSIQTAASHYEDELAQLGDSYTAACAADIEALKLAIASTAESSMIGVGSGGSFTVASLLCSLHEAYTGRVSRPSTPLEIICSPALAASSPVFLLSAEGKNPDIVEALERARRFSSRTIHVLTNRKDSPLMQHVGALPGVKPYVFELAKKDGYLATNSLLLDAVLVARAYGELNGRRRADARYLAAWGLAIRPWMSGWLLHSPSSQRQCGVAHSPLSTRPCCEPSPPTWSPSSLKGRFCTSNWPIFVLMPTVGTCGLLSARKTAQFLRWSSHR